MEVLETASPSSSHPRRGNPLVPGIPKASDQSCRILWKDTDGSCPAVTSPISWDLSTSWEGEEQVSALPPLRQAPTLPLESPKALGQVRGTTESSP